MFPLWKSLRPHERIVRFLIVSLRETLYPCTFHNIVHAPLQRAALLSNHRAFLPTLHQTYGIDPCLPREYIRGTFTEFLDRESRSASGLHRECARRDGKEAAAPDVIQIEI